MSAPVSLSALSPSSTVRDALLAYVATPAVVTRCADVPRHAEPWLVLARSPRHAALSSLTIAHVTRRVASGFRDSLQSAGYSYSAIQLYLGKLALCWDALLDYEIVPVNPWRTITRPAKTLRKRAQLCLTREQSQRVEFYLRTLNPLYADAWLVALSTAMRINEILTIRVCDLDLPGHRLFVPVSSDKARRGRWVYYPASTARILARLADGLAPHATLFPVQKGTLQHALLRARRNDPAFPAASWHTARHTAISLLGQQPRLSLGELMAFSGHKTIRAATVYFHADDERNGAALLSRMASDERSISMDERSPIHQ